LRTFSNGTMSDVKLSEVKELTTNATDLVYRTNGLYLAKTATAEAEAGLSLSINPNPVSESATIEFTLPESSSITLELYSLQGELVSRIASGYYDAGSHTLDYSQNIASGVYNLVLRSGNQTKNVKVVINN
jgi:hypothetical protein